MAKAYVVLQLPQPNTQKKRKTITKIVQSRNSVYHYLPQREEHNVRPLVGGNRMILFAYLTNTLE